MREEHAGARVKGAAGELLVGERPRGALGERKGGDVRVPARGAGEAGRRELARIGVAGGDEHLEDGLVFRRRRKAGHVRAHLERAIERGQSGRAGQCRPPDQPERRCHVRCTRDCNRQQ